MIIVETRAVGPFFKNGFVVACSSTHQGVLIDPGDEVDGLLEFATLKHVALTHILLTHAHVDHVTGVAAAKRALHVPVYLHRDDLFLYEQAVQHGLIFGLHVEPPPPVDEFYSPGEVIQVGDYDVRPHHTPGHCPGGVCLEVRQRAGGAGKAGEAGEADTADSAGMASRSGESGTVGEAGTAGGVGTHLFVGDTLFAGSIGRTDLPGADHATLIASIRNVLFAFDDAAVVYPGHGPKTTIGHERRTNPFLVV